MEIKSVDLHTAKHNSRPLRYPAGTCMATTTFARTGEPIDYNLIVGMAITHWLNAHGASTDPDDLFITIAFGTFDVVVEVSDRLRG